MKNSLLIVIFALSVVFASCTSAEELRPQRTVITGVVENIDDNHRIVTINFCDWMAAKDRVIQNLEESGGRFHAENDYVFAQNMTVRYGNYFINIYVEPGDSVFVKIDGKRLAQRDYSAVEFSGDNAQVSSQLNKWHAYAASFPLPKLKTDGSVEEYIADFSRYTEVFKDSIDAYAGRNELSDFIKEWAVRDMKFSVTNSIHPETSENIWNAFMHPFFDIYNRDNFSTMMFPYHLSAAAGALRRSDPELLPMLESGDFGGVLRRIARTLEKEVKEGPVRDMMFYTLASFLINNEQLGGTAAYDSVPEISTFFSQPVFAERLQEQVEAIKKQQAERFSVNGQILAGISYINAENQIENLPETSLMSYLVEKYKGKALYIDVWATWCGPCLAEVPYARQMQNYFAGRNDVVFVNLCLGSPANLWVKTLAEHNITGENYFLDEVASATFMQEYQLSGYPSYLLVDKKGGIVTNKAPRPSHANETVRLIEKYL